MRTNIEIDDGLMAEAARRSGLKSARDVIDFVLKRYVRQERQREALEGLRGLGRESDPDAIRTDHLVREWD